MPRNLGCLLTPFMLACFAVAYAYVTWFAGGDLVVVAPPQSELTVLIDGETVVVPRGATRTLSLSRGTRAIALESSAGRVEQSLEIVDGFSRYLVSAKDQCFVLADIGESYRPQGTTGAPPPPEVVTRVYSGDRCKLSGNIYLPGKEPPTVHSQKYVRVVLVRELDCNLFALGVGERAQLEAVGLQ